MQNGIMLDRVINTPGRPRSHADYVALGGLALSCAYLVVFVTTSKIARIQVLMIFVLLYLLWGVFHHKRNDTLTWNVMLEYTAFAAFLLLLLGLFLIL